jgi:hypothetical protein
MAISATRDYASLSKGLVEPFVSAGVITIDPSLQSSRYKSQMM